MEFLLMAGGSAGRKSGLWLTLGAACGFVAVAAGAFGAHDLKGRIDAAALAVFETGTRYLMYHALALLAVAWAAGRGAGRRAVALAGWGFLVGSVMFTGSLYLLALSGSRALVMLTPLGGLILLAGWAGLFAAGLGLWRAARADEAL